MAWVEEVKPKRRINSILPSQPQFKPLNSVKPISIKSQDKAVTAVLISIIGSFIIGFPGGGYRNPLPEEGYLHKERKINFISA